mgnify:CR=1 FL=1
MRFITLCRLVMPSRDTIARKAALLAKVASPLSRRRAAPANMRWQAAQAGLIADAPDRGQELHRQRIHGRTRALPQIVDRRAGCRAQRERDVGRAADARPLAQPRRGPASAVSRSWTRSTQRRGARASGSTASPAAATIARRSASGSPGSASPAAALDRRGGILAASLGRCRPAGQCGDRRLRSFFSARCAAAPPFSGSALRVFAAPRRARLQAAPDPSPPRPSGGQRRRHHEHRS